MSIIEKAAGKLPTPPSGHARQEADPEARESLIEGAVRRSRSARADVAAAVDEPATIWGSEPEDGHSRSQIQQVNMARLSHMGFITPENEKSQAAEEFRIIKRPLIANAFGQGTARVRNGNLIMVTSAMPGEGKTYCAINLAISMAMEMERTVLLVDADVARPRVPEYLGLQADRGLLDVLREKDLKLSDLLIRTDIAKLTVLPAGRTYKRATELLASSAMTQLVEDIGNRYPDRIIVFDSPPLLATSEAGVLATHMGQIVLVVEAERTPQDAVREAINHVQSCDVVNLLLNKATPTPGSDYYYGYYGSYGK